MQGMYQALLIAGEGFERPLPDDEGPTLPINEQQNQEIVDYQKLKA